MIYIMMLLFTGGFVIEDALRRNFTVQPLADDRRNWLIGKKQIIMYKCDCTEYELIFENKALKADLICSHN